MLIRCTRNRIRETASLLPTSPSQSQSAFFFAASVSETTPAQVLFNRTATVGNSISYSVIPIGFCHNHVVNGGVPLPPQHRIRHLTLFFLVMLCFRNGFPACCKTCSCGIRTGSDSVPAPAKHNNTPAITAAVIFRKKPMQIPLSVFKLPDTDSIYP